MARREDVRIAAVAALLANPARAAMLQELVSYGPLAATDLASAAGVSQATASAYLAKLERGGLIIVQRSGRIRHYRIARPPVARALEALAELAADASGPSSETIAEPARPDDRRARTCYDHLAGGLGIALADAMLRARLITSRRSGRATKSGGFALTRKGREFMLAFGIDPRGMLSQERSFAGACLDRTEGRPHIAGALGAALAAHLHQLGWTKAVPGSRALRVTRAGTSGLRQWFGVEL